MLDAGSPRFRLAALIAAGLALVLAAVAVVVMATRSGPAAAGAAVVERRVAATDVAALRADAVEVVVEAGQPVGVRVRDATLATALGLAPDEVLVSISGRPTLRDSDVREAGAGLGILRATSVYVETRRGGRTSLVRWLLDGDLRDARHAALAPAGPPGPRRRPRLTPDPSVADANAATRDTLRATIEEIDDEHFRLPLTTVETALDNPAMMAREGRLVPSIKNGRSNGIKLYAVRPSSILAKLGLRNGDTIHTVAGLPVADFDQAADLIERIRTADEVVVELTRRGRPVTLTYVLTR